MKPELLAPAGGFEQLRSAIHFGADAVYLGDVRFGLRKRAVNFSEQDIGAAVQEAHQAGVRVHVTVNSILHENDLKDLVPYLHLVYEAGADAVIATDLATIDCAHKEVPRLEIHASTQLSCANSAAAIVLHEMGCKRIILARELTLAEIAAIRKKVPESLELETFVHGAMCMAYSGRCIISNYLKGRDANRGHCAQPCRWEYELVEKQRPDIHIPITEDGRGTSLLSSKDLCMLEHLDDMVKAGVNSLKVEGRGKSAFYVATVVNAYRHVLDGARPHEYLSELEKVSHRPYHTGFFYGNPEQTGNDDEYESTHLLCGVVVESREAEGDEYGNKSWCIFFEVRNRMQAGQTIEILSPKISGRSFVFKRAYNEHVGETLVANRVCEIYKTDCPYPLEPGDMLRRMRDEGEERLRALHVSTARCGFDAV